MKPLRRWLTRFTGLVAPHPNRDRDLADELESNLQLHIEDNLRAGMTPEQARRDAILKLGGIEIVKEAYRDAQTVPVLDHLFQDIHFSVRQLRKNAGFTTTAILMLALGMCASVAIFAFVDAALIKPLPYRDPARLAGVFERIAAFTQSNLSYPDYLDWKRLNSVFSSLDVYNYTGFTMTTPTGVEPVRATRVTDGFFRTLGVQPAKGRDFYSGEDLLGAPRTALITYTAWQKRFGGSDSVLGQTVVLDGNAHVIVGILPPDFHFPPAEPSEFWTTFHAQSECDLRRSCHGIYGVARLKDGVSFVAALSNITAIAEQLEKLYPGDNKGQGAFLAPLAEVIVGRIRPILLLLLSGAALLLLIAAVNVAGLLLVRSESRKREIAVRAALGASTGRMLSQFVAEGLVLVAAGTALGLASAWGAIQLLTRLIPPNLLANLSYLQGLTLNGRVLLFAAAIAFLAAILFSLTPALHLSSPDVREGLAEGSRGSSGTVWSRLGGKLVVLELATAVVLLVGAGLLGKSLYRLLQVDLGFLPDQLVSVDVFAPEASFGKEPQQIALARQIIAELESLPGVKSAAISENGVPLDGNGNTTWFRVLGRPWNGEHNDTPERDITAGYFPTIGAKLLRGRYFNESEDTAKPRVAIINRSFAQKHFPGEDPLGKQIAMLSTRPVPIEIVGIVENIREGSLDAAIPPVLYLPFNQGPDRGFSVVVRTAGAASLIPEIVSRIHRINSGIVTVRPASMKDRIGNSAYTQRSSAWLVGAFAVLALLLGVTGLYGVVAYSVSQRTREIGVRIALGARPGSVYKLVLKEAGTLAAFGIAIGLACSVAAATLIAGLLFNVHSWDVPTLASVALLLGAAAMLASFIPARRAASVNPVDALRAE